LCISAINKHRHHTTNTAVESEQSSHRKATRYSYVTRFIADMIYEMLKQLLL